MNKKLKRMLATVSAVVTCAVSMASVSAGAVYIPTDKSVTPYTTSFRLSKRDGKGLKFNLWQEATDYFDNEKLKVYISEPVDYVWNGNEETKHLIGTKTYKVMGYYEYSGTCPFIFGGYEFDNEDDVAILEKYLSDNNINYEYRIDNTSRHIYITPKLPDGMNRDDRMQMLIDRMQMLIDIKENTGLICGWSLQESFVQVADIENELPEPTLIGDANEDGVVNISDAVLIMQSISNPHEYQLSIQGMANADVVDNDGITLLDALRIQEMSAGL